MSTVLVTGAGGFVGSAVVRRLVGVDALLWDGTAVEHVVALLRPGGSAERLEELPDDGSWSIAPADVDDRAQLDAVLREARPRAIVNAVLDRRAHAGCTSGVTTLETLLAFLAEHDDARLVHAGSAWVLAPGERLDESAAVQPASPYARHKAEEDAALAALGERFGVPWVNLRLFNIFGRYEDGGRLLPTLVARLSRGERAEVSHGEQLRDFNDVGDIADAFRLALAAPPSACDAVYHIGTGRATSVREYAGLVAETVGDPSLIRFGASRTRDDELPSLVADPSRARAALGWRSDDVLEERVRAAAAWWLERLATPAAAQEECHR